MRIHEVLGIKHGAGHHGHRFEIQGDETEGVDEFSNNLFFLKSRSEKTHEGEAEWVCPESTTRAIDILASYCEPLHKEVGLQLEQAKIDSNITEIKRLEALSGSVFLSKSYVTKKKIDGFSSSAITEYRLPKLAKNAGVNWNLSPHQLRRTFANYVAHSDLGDLRYLRDHFKHWSIGMTSMYATNQNLDHELYEEMLRERFFIEQEIKEDWFSIDKPITGGDIANKIMKIRSSNEAVKVFDSREAMIRSYTKDIPLRATGLAWCTNDDDGCLGGKCEECEHGIVDFRNTVFWKGLLIQQLELSGLGDIGHSGKEAIKKGMKRSERVLMVLGHNVVKIKKEAQGDINNAS